MTGHAKKSAPSRSALPGTSVIFLGAGASAAEGAPIQATLLRDFFMAYQRQVAKVEHEWDRELATFFLAFFGIDVDRDPLRNALFPTFEEVLGILELAESQKEGFRGWGTSNIIDGSKKPRIEHMRDLLVLLIAQALDNALQGPPAHHAALVQNLGSGLRRSSFVSLNYDILIDNALLALYPKLDLDYAVDFVNYGVGTWTRPRRNRSVYLLKLHGSLNWLFCPTCRSLELTPKTKGVCRLKWEPGKCLCRTCSTLAVPIIIPPTYFKALSNLFLRQIWDAAERHIMHCDRLVFCGYSFPDADIHIRYLLKRVDINRKSSPDIFVVSEHPGKTERARSDERARYMRFFKDKARLHWTRLSFEEFAADPRAVLASSSWVS